MFFQNFSLQQGAIRQGAGSAGHERQEETSNDVLPKLQRLAGHAHASQQQEGRAQIQQNIQQELEVRK